MLYNHKGYTIEIPDDLYWELSDQEFNEYIETKLIESFSYSTDTPKSLPEDDFTDLEK